MKKIIYLFLLNYTSLFSISANDFITKAKCDQIIDKRFLKICYNYDLRAAKAVSYTLHGDLVNAVNIKKRPYFKVEKLIPRAYRARYKDYTHSGWDRGHLAPDAAFDWSQESLDATYFLGNIIPQSRKVNRYIWTKAERYARFVAVQRGEINVVNVVIYPMSPLRIGAIRIAVPVGYYKIIYSSDQSFKKCFYYKNSNDIIKKTDRLRNHVVDCNNIKY